MPHPCGGGLRDGYRAGTAVRAVQARAGPGAAHGEGASPARGPPPASALLRGTTGHASAGFDFGSLWAEHGGLRPGRRGLLKLTDVVLFERSRALIDVYGSVELSGEQAAKFGCPRHVTAIVRVQQRLDRLEAVADATGHVLWAVLTSIAPKTTLGDDGRSIRLLRGRIALHEFLSPDREYD